MITRLEWIKLFYLRQLIRVGPEFISHGSASPEEAEAHAHDDAVRLLSPLTPLRRPQELTQWTSGTRFTIPAVADGEKCSCTVAILRALDALVRRFVALRAFWTSFWVQHVFCERTLVSLKPSRKARHTAPCRFLAEFLTRIHCAIIIFHALHALFHALQTFFACS